MEEIKTGSMKMMTKANAKYLLTVLLTMVFVLIQGWRLAAQDINKEVYVVRPYEPTLSDASKYNFLPSTDDLETNLPHFAYSITPRPLMNNFEPNPIKAAKTVTTSLPKIYNSWLKLGMGNYSTPMVEFNISNLRSKDYAFGAYLYHKSSYGKIGLPNDQKVPAGYVINNINVYGKRFFARNTLSGNLRMDQHAFRFYGYNTGIFSDPLPDMKNDSIKERTYQAGIDLSLGTTFDDINQLNYKVSASMDYFIDRLKFNETDVVVRTGLNKDFNGLLGGLDVSVDYSRVNGSADSLNNTILRFSPWISKQNTDWKFVLGFEGAADIAEITRFYIYPRAHLDIIIIENVLVPFIGLSGELQKNTYKNIFAENQFIVPGTFFKNRSSNFIAYAGLKGSVSSVLRFRADVSYTKFKDFHFFVNDTLLPLENQFTAVYDDADLFTYHGQLVAQPTAGLEISLDGKYFDYKTYDQLKPWHEPDFNIAFGTSYKFSSKFTAGVDFTVTGNRWVRDYTLPEKINKLKPIPDINLKINYQYSKLFSLFADFYNLTDRSYLIWNQYPSQRFNFLFGFSYKL